MKRSESMRPVLRRGSPIKDDLFATRPMLRKTQSMTPSIESITSISKPLSTQSNNIDMDESENSDDTELVLLEDEPLVPVEVVQARVPEIGCKETPALSSKMPRSKSDEAPVKEIFAITQQGSSLDESSVGVPERFVTPRNSFRSPVQREDSLRLELAPRTKRLVLNLNVKELMASGSSFRQKLVRGTSLLQSDSASRSGSFCSQDGSSTSDIKLDGGSMMPPSFPISTNDPGRFVTPINSFMNSSNTNTAPFDGAAEPNRAPQASRRVVTVEDFERCMLPNADSVRQKIVRGPSLLRSSSGDSLPRSSFSRFLSRYSTDDSLAPLKEEVKVDKKKGRRGSKKIKEVKIVPEQNKASARTPNPAVFGLFRKSSIMRGGEKGPLEGSSSHHTKTTVGVAEDSLSGASFGDSHNNNELSISSIADDSSESTTEYEEQDGDLLTGTLPEARERPSFASTASGNSWARYEAWDQWD